MAEQGAPGPAGEAGRPRLGVAVIGAGYWGPNLFRTVDAAADWELRGAGGAGFIGSQQAWALEVLVGTAR